MFTCWSLDLNPGLPHHRVDHASEMVDWTPEDTPTEGKKGDGQREEAMHAVLVQLALGADTGPGAETSIGGHTAVAAVSFPC